MKLKLKRCHICHDWFSPLRSHCPNCGAAEIAPGTFMAVSNNGKLQFVGSAYNRFHFKKNALEIARELAK